MNCALTAKPPHAATTWIRVSWPTSRPSSFSLPKSHTTKDLSTPG